MILSVTLPKVQHTAYLVFLVIIILIIPLLKPLLPLSLLLKKYQKICCDHKILKNEFGTLNNIVLTNAYLNEHSKAQGNYSLSLLNIYTHFWAYGAQNKR